MSEEVKEEKQPRKYLDLIKMCKDALDSVKAGFEARKAEKDLEKEIITIEQEIAEQEVNLMNAKSKRPFVLRDVLDAVDKKDLLERDLKLAKQIQEELF